MVVLVNTLENSAIRAICADHGNRPDAVIEILHDVQAKEHYLSDASLREIADTLNISHAEIHGIVSFYTDFHREKPADTIVKICGAEACQAVGARELIEHGHSVAGASKGDVELEVVYCLGNCALGPAMMIDDQLYGKIGMQKFDEIVDLHASQKKVSQ